MSAGPYYYGRERSDDFYAGVELLAGERDAGRPRDHIPLNAQTTHFGGLVLASDAVLTLSGILTSDPPQRPEVVIPGRRVRSIAERWKGRNRGVRWQRVIGPVYDQPEHLGQLTMVGDAQAGLNALVVTPNVVLGELLMVGDAALALPGINVIGVVPGQGLAMVGDAVMSGTGTEIYAALLPMVGDATLQLNGTGGASAGLDPRQRRGGIVTIGTRGGHS